MISKLVVESLENVRSNLILLMAGRDVNVGPHDKQVTKSYLRVIMITNGCRNGMSVETIGGDECPGSSNC